jgi:hypothetical protein
MRSRSTVTALAATAVAGLAVTGTSVAGGGFDNPPQPGPSKFQKKVDNPFFPLRPGTTYIYRGRTDGARSRIVFRVTRRTKRIQGVDCVVVRDRHYVRGKLREDTFDWFAQDRAGNVWYFGESTRELDERGRVVTTAGSWKAGRDGARAGIVMPAHPRVGDRYRQEYYKGEAEDEFRILSRSARVKVPYRKFRRVLKTRDTTPLDRTVRENKFYARGIGLIADADLDGSGDRSKLVSVKRR